MADSSAYYVIQAKHLRRVAYIMAALAAALLAITAVLAEPAGSAPASSNDGRINVVHHFGGDVLYCVDKDTIATHDFFTNDEGGFQLINMQGERLWFVPAATVLEKVAQAQPGGGNVLVAEGQGSYGPVAIYTYKMTDGTIHFIFTGVDEHGSQNQMDFERCLPVNPPASQSLCTADEIIETLINSDFEGFIRCYDRACPGIPFGVTTSASLSSGIECLCSKYPDLCKVG